MLKDTKIGKKLVGGFLIVAFISVIIGYVGYSGMGMMEVHLDQITEVRLPSIEALDVIVAGQIALKASERTLLIKGVDAAQQQQQFKQVEETWERIEAAWKKYEPLEQTREALSHSKIGYIYYYNEDSREFILNTWSRDVMEQCAVQDPKICYELDKTGIWGEVIRQRQPIFSGRASPQKRVSAGTRADLPLPLHSPH